MNTIQQRQPNNAHETLNSGYKASEIASVVSFSAVAATVLLGAVIYDSFNNTRPGRFVHRELSMLNSIGKAMHNGTPKL